MLIRDTSLLSMQILHVANGVVVDVVALRQVDWATFEVHEIVHDIYSLLICLQVVFKTSFSNSCFRFRYWDRLGGLVVVFISADLIYGKKAGKLFR